MANGGITWENAEAETWYADRSLSQSRILGASYAPFGPLLLVGDLC